jgi:WD40 repeat protein
MEMLVTGDGRFLLLSFKGKPRLELWDLTKPPIPMCV